MKERIVEFLKSENKSSATFAEEIGVQASSISHIISGRNNPSLDFVIKMLKRYPSLSSDWLLFGKGSMYADSAMQNLFEANPPEKDIPDSGQFEFELDNRRIENKIDHERPILTSDSVKERTSSNEKKAVRIVYFFDDGTYHEYFPDDHRQ
jgi:transcriptional regulator with XRE-family HTH domain